jgi:hypothetical protein
MNADKTISDGINPVYPLGDMKNLHILLVYQRLSDFICGQLRFLG